MLSPEWIELSVSSGNQQQLLITYLREPEDRYPTFTGDMYRGILDRLLVSIMSAMSDW